MSTVKRTAVSTAARNGPARSKTGEKQLGTAVSEASRHRAESREKSQAPDKGRPNKTSETPHRPASPAAARSQHLSERREQSAHATPAAVSLTSSVTSSPGLALWGGEPIASSLQKAVETGSGAMSSLSRFFSGEPSAARPLRAETSPPEIQSIGEGMDDNAGGVDSSSQSFFDPQTQSPVFWTRPLKAQTLSSLLANSLKHPSFTKEGRPIEVPHMRAVPLSLSDEAENQLVAENTKAVVKALGSRRLLRVSDNLHKIEIPHLDKQVLLLTTLVSQGDKNTDLTPVRRTSVLSQREVAPIMSLLKKKKEGEPLQLSINMAGRGSRLSATERERLRLVFLAAGVAISPNDLTTRSLGGREFNVRIAGTFVRSMLE